MKRCIYFNESTEKLAFTEKEHVIPASIGGISKLDKGVVSNEANKFFSKFETEFSGSSIIALKKMFIGPGKRGKLSEKKKFTSNVGIAFDNDIPQQLAYITLGEHELIPTLEINIIHEKFNFFPLELENIQEEYLKLMEKVDINGKFNVIENNCFEDGVAFIGSKKKKLYVAKNKETKLENILRKLEFLKQSQINFSNAFQEEYQPKVTISNKWNIYDFYRICAKISFNTLAYIKGKDVVLKEEFTQIRNFILSRTNEERVNFMTDENKIKALNELRSRNHLSEKSHIISITCTNEKVTAILSLYGEFNFVVNMADKNSIGAGTLTFACDWEKREEKIIERF